MVERDTDETESRPDHTDRYRYVEYDEEDGSVSVIQDTENERAWIQSTHTVAVEP